MKKTPFEQTLIKVLHQTMLAASIITLAMLGIAIALLLGVFSPKPLVNFSGNTTQTNQVAINEPMPPAIPPIPEKNWWKAPNPATIPADTEEGKLIAYGKEVISNTAAYLGPKGSVRHSSNGMNCQNCHLDAGTRTLGNNYGAVASTYPKFRERSGSMESIEKRVNDCFERSLNGKPLDSLSKEMRAIVAYINWLGKDIPKGDKPDGSGIWELAYLDRPANPDKGKEVYTQKCQVCHQADGNGQLNPDGITYLYPPLWGNNSYNIGAGLYRLSRFAGYAKVNMPLGATHQMPMLTDEEAWDVAAYVNSQPRPKKDLSKDWPNIAGKPIDHPFGPYHDGFTEQEHKYGPFKPIAEKRKQLKEAVSAKK